MNCHTDAVGSVMFVEGNSLHPEALANWSCPDLAREQPTSALSFSHSSSLSPYFPDIRRVSRTLTEAQVKVITVLIMVTKMTIRTMIIHSLIPIMTTNIMMTMYDDMVTTMTKISHQ